METLTPSQVKNGLKDRNSLVHFMGTVLGYRPELVLYESPAEELGIPAYLTTKIKNWWLISHYPGTLPLQVHFLQLIRYDLTFHTCASIARLFHHRYPGYYLFIFTQDFTYFVFMAVEWSLERRRVAESLTWPFEPKPYPRFLLMNRENPSNSDLLTLSLMTASKPDDEPSALHAKIIHAIGKAERWEPIPEWFLPHWYRLRDPSQYLEAIDNVGDLLLKAADCLSGCLASSSLSALGTVYDCIEAITHLNDVDELLSVEDVQRLLYVSKRLGDAEDACEDDIDEAMLYLQDALVGITRVHARLVESEDIRSLIGDEYDEYGSSGYY